MALTPKLRPQSAEVLTFMKDSETVESSRIIFIHRRSDTTWLIKHLTWAIVNGRDVEISPIPATKFDPSQFALAI